MRRASVGSSKNNSKLLREAEDFVQSAQTRLDKAKKVSDEARASIQEHLNQLRHAIKDNDPKRIEQQNERARALVQEHLGEVQKSAFREYAESIALAVLFAMVLRAFVVEAFKIPSGSMIPTLLVGDHLFVNKFIYGLRVPLTQKYLARFAEPKRGEVVVFTFPSAEAREHLSKQPASQRECIGSDILDTEKDFIKRIVGVAGDKVEMRKNILFINDRPVTRKFIAKESTGVYVWPSSVKEYETLGDYRYIIQYNGRTPDFGPIKVKPGHVFAMGDNRDHSADSRCWGQVPLKNLKGRAIFIWLSSGPDGQRWGRIGQFIHEDTP